MNKWCRHFRFIRLRYVALMVLGWVLLQVSIVAADPADRLTFSGSFIIAPQYGIMSGKDRQLLFNYRGRLQTTAQIVPKEVALIMAIEGADGSVFMGDTVFTRELINTIANDADQNNIANRPTLHFQKAHFYFHPLKETNRTGKLEVVVGLFDQFEHFPPPVNFAVTGNKEVVTAGLGWYSDGFPFIAKNYVAFGYNRVATFSNVATGFGPTGEVPEYENWFEVFWRHQWAPGFEVTPHLTVVTNPGGTDQNTLYIPSFRMVAFF